MVITKEKRDEALRRLGWIIEEFKLHTGTSKPDYHYLQRLKGEAVVCMEVVEDYYIERQAKEKEV